MRTFVSLRNVSGGLLGSSVGHGPFISKDHASRPLAAARASAAYPQTGSATWNVLPRPGVLSAQIRPPCPCTMHLEM